MIFSIVIPCYNEAATLPLLIERCQEVVEESPYELEFILVDNGSNDDTQETLKSINIPQNVEIFKKEINNGYGAGIKYGLTKVKTEFSGWMHADLQQDVKIKI